MRGSNFWLGVAVARDDQRRARKAKAIRRVRRDGVRPSDLSAGSGFAQWLQTVAGLLFLIAVVWLVCQFL